MSVAALAAVPSPPARRSGLTLLVQARAVLDEAVAESTPPERYRLAHLAALRCSAALFAERARPSGRRRGPTSAWVLLVAVAPEFGEWAEYFAAGATRRAAVEAGALHAVNAREADDLLRAAEQFYEIIQAALGVLAVPLAS